MLNRLKKPIIIAHSGCMDQAEETLDFMSVGYDAGAKGFEIDLNMTLDKVGVLSHDDNIADDKGEMMDLTKLSFAEAKARRKSLVTFEEAIAKAKQYEALMNVDVKNLEVVPVALEAIERMDFSGNAYFTGIGLKNAEHLRNLYPSLRVAVNLKMCGHTSSEIPILPSIAKDATDRCKEIGAVGINVEWKLCSKEWIAYAQQLGMFTSCWTVDEEKDIREIAGWGTDLITTNRPDRVFRFLKNYK